MVAQTVTYSDIADRQIGLGIALIVTGLLAGALLQYTRRIRYMPSYFIANFPFFKNKNPKLPVVAAVFYYILLAAPVVILLIWLIILGANLGANPALPILFLTLFIGFLFIPSYNKLFYFKILAAFIAYIAAQILALGLVFNYQSQTSFWTLTAVSLTINSLFVIIAMWFLDETIWTIPQDAPASIKDKIQKQVKIWKVKEEPPQIINAGLYGRVLSLNKPIRYVVVVVIYVFSMIILAIYSVVGKYKTSSNFQALVNSVAVVTTDIISFMLLVISRKIGFDPNLNSLFVIAVRVCIVAFSGPYWFFGYCLLYLILMIYTSALLINKFYPTFQKHPSTQVKNTNILKMPQTAFILLLLIFSALVYFIGVDEGKNLPILQAKIGQGLYPFWAVGVATILLSFAAFFYLLSLRIVDRSRKKIRSSNSYYLGCQNCSQYYVFIFASYSFLVILGFYLYSVVGAKIIWASCVFLPLFYQSFVLFYENWKQNDYLLLGQVAEFNKKLKKKKERQEKIRQMRNSVISKMKQDNKEDEQNLMAQQMNIQAMDNARVQQNWVIENYDLNNAYVDWRAANSTFYQAFKTGKLLPTDKRIIISIPIMICSLVAYSLTFFFIENHDMTAFTVSVQILVLFLIFVPTKRYFSTFQNVDLLQIVSFTLGLVLNYAFGIISYVIGWNNSPAYTVLWAVANALLVVIYATVCLIRDKGLVLPTVIVSIVSMVISFGPGIILLTWFSSVPIGIALIGAGFYYSYFLSTILIYKKMNDSVPFALYPITIIIIIGTCCAVMIYAFINDQFDDFYGFSITYLVISLLGLFYAIYRTGSDILTRFQKPNFFSPYGTPVYKYDFNIRSVVQNQIPLKIWLGFWFMFYLYTILMQIFIKDTNYGTATSMIPLIVFSLTFFYVVTYNANRAGRIRADITNEILESSWEQVIQIRQKQLGNFLNYDDLQKQLQETLKKKKDGDKTIKSNRIRIVPKQSMKKQNLNEQSQMNQTTTKVNTSGADQQQLDIDHYIYNLQIKLGKAAQNDSILLVNYWTNIIFKTQSKRKKRMLQFINFIKDCGDILASTGITLVLNDTLYDLEMIYNQAFQEVHNLSALQKVFFNKQLKLYLERKQKEDKEKQEVNKKQVENDIKRQKQIQNRLLNGDDDKDDDNLPYEKMKDGPVKLKKMKDAVKADYSDPLFKTVVDYIPQEARSLVKGWKRPTKTSVLMKGDLASGMGVRQGSIGNCYLISAIGVLGKDRIRQIISDPSQCPPGTYMVKFQKFGKQVYVIVDDNFPVADTNVENQWLFGRCQDPKQIFCNVIEKAYAKLYGGYNKIVGGKVALALSDMTGGFPQQIQLKPYQQTNTNQIFDKMLKFKAAGYLMGAGSPPNVRGDAVEIDGIYQGHAYLVIDVKNLDGNKIIKLRNPHGNQSRESTLDWSDDSPKWTSRLKGLLGQTMAKDGAFWMGLQDFVYCFRALYICRIFDSSWKKLGPFKGQWKGQSAAGLKSSSGTPILANNPHFGIKVTRACTLFVQMTQNQAASDGGSGKNQIFFMIQRNSGKRIDAPATNKLVGMSGPAINSKTISKQINMTADSFPYTFSLMTSIYMAGSEGSFNISFYCNDANIQIIQDANFGR